MKQFTHWLDPDAMAAVERLVGKMKISEFVREAITAELKRRGLTIRSTQMDTSDK